MKTDLLQKFDVDPSKGLSCEVVAKKSTRIWRKSIGG
jgi:hypothetical protein